MVPARCPCVMDSGHTRQIVSRSPWKDDDLGAGKAGGRSGIAELRRGNPTAIARDYRKPGAFEARWQRERREFAGRDVVAGSTMQTCVRVGIVDYGGHHRCAVVVERKWERPFP